MDVRAILWNVSLFTHSYQRRSGEIFAVHCSATFFSQAYICTFHLIKPKHVAHKIFADFSSGYGNFPLSSMRKTTVGFRKKTHTYFARVIIGINSNVFLWFHLSSFFSCRFGLRFVVFLLVLFSLSWIALFFAFSFAFILFFLPSIDRLHWMQSYLYNYPTHEQNYRELFLDIQRQQRYETILNNWEERAEKRQRQSEWKRKT